MDGGGGVGTILGLAGVAGGGVGLGGAGVGGEGFGVGIGMGTGGVIGFFSGGNSTPPLQPSGKK